jgi:hypothetical protein
MIGLCTLTGIVSVVGGRAIVTRLSDINSFALLTAGTKLLLPAGRKYLSYLLRMVSSISLMTIFTPDSFSSYL